MAPRKTTKTKFAPLTEMQPGDEWAYINATLGNADRVLLYGPPGTGKTTIANSNVTHVYNVYMTEETPAAELRGHFIPRGTSWEWMHGPAIRAWMEGSRLVINEINAASGDALDFLLAVLDDKSMAGITLPNGESVKPHPGFNCVATMNGQPEDLPEALRDRFSIRFNVKKANDQAIASLPEDLHQIALAKMTTVPSVRPWQQFAELRARTNDQVAAYAVFGNGAAAVLDAIRIGSAAAS
jgi:MoxR-like ATPase